MGRVDPRLFRQLGEAGERCMQLCRSATQQSSAAGAEERVAGKEKAVAEIGDVGLRVTGNRHHVQIQRAIEQGHTIALAEFVVYRTDSRIIRSVDRYRVSGNQGRNSADMVRMMMRNQNSLEYESMTIKPFLNDPCITGVNHHGLAAALDEPDIVIVERRKRDNLNAGGFGMSSRHV